MKRFSLSLLAVIFSFLIFSCHDPFVYNTGLDIPPGMGSFTLSLSPARTILPDTPRLSDFFDFQLIFTATSGGRNESERRAADGDNPILAPVYLMPGTYNLTVNAYKEGTTSGTRGPLAARGTKNGIVIVSDASISETIMLNALLTEGTGTFSWDITIDTSPAITVNSATMTINNLSGNPVHGPINLNTEGDRKTVGSHSLSSGVYSVVFNLIENNSKAVVWYEVLHVYAALDSSFQITFTDDHFNKTHYQVTLYYNYTGNSEFITESVMHGNTATAPGHTRESNVYLYLDPAPVTPGWNLEGWYNNEAPENGIKWDFSKPVDNDMILYANWTGSIDVSSFTFDGNNFEKAIAYVKDHSDNGQTYTLFVNDDFDVKPQVINTSDIKLTIIGMEQARELRLSENGVLFTIGAPICIGIELTLGNNISLVGRYNEENGNENNNNTLVRVQNGASFTMNGNSMITGNYFSWNSGISGGGGVTIDYGTFTMNDNSKITNNINDGEGSGGVTVTGGGTLVMNGNSEISRNRAIYAATGGGVHIENGTFLLNSGNISENYTSGNGAVNIGQAGIFTMTGGNIVGNDSYMYGGGVYVEGIFNMDNGTISRNRNMHGSAAVYIAGPSTNNGTGIFTMTGGSITENFGGGYNGCSIFAGGNFPVISIKGGTINNNSGAFGDIAHLTGSLNLSGDAKIGKIFLTLSYKSINIEDDWEGEIAEIILEWDDYYGGSPNDWEGKAILTGNVNAGLNGLSFTGFFPQMSVYDLPIPPPLSISSTHHIDSGGILRLNPFDLYEEVAKYENATANMEIVVPANIALQQNVVIPPNTSGATLTIRSNAPARILSRSIEDDDPESALFIVSANARLVFENIIVDGKSGLSSSSSGFTGNEASLVRIIGSDGQTSAGIFTMNDGAVLRNNRAYQGGAVRAVDNVNPGRFVMNGGSIVDNMTVNGGGGIDVFGNSAISGGHITWNRLLSNDTISDVYTRNYPITLSGTASIHTLSLEANAVFKPSIIIGAAGFKSWVNTLNLIYNSSMAETINCWQGERIIQAVGILTEEDLEGITLGNFISYGETQAIDDTHFIVTSGSNIGRLMSLSSTDDYTFNITIHKIDEWNLLDEDELVFDIFDEPSLLPKTFEVEVAYRDGYTYQWYLDGNALTGETSYQYEFNVSSEKQAGNFELVVVVTKNGSDESRSGGVRIRVER
ncbi:MAG: hypothetical protein FWD26_05260 [Treponema sp.]|nr:hypothetical protein [Treponema sp.]